MIKKNTADINPLDLDDYQKPSILNKCGRPIKGNMIIFGPQHQSFVSKFFKNYKDNRIFLNNCPRIVSKESDKFNQDLTNDGDISHNESYSSFINDTSCLSSDYGKAKKDKYRDGGVPPRSLKHTMNSTTVIEMKKKMDQNEKYVCSYANCTYSTRDSSNLKRHKRTHTLEKPYLCDICPFQSKFVNSLKTHKRIHTNEKPFICLSCSYTCNSSSNLKKHCKYKHSM